MRNIVCNENNLFIEPDYMLISGYFTSEICRDERDNNCNGEIDEPSCVVICGDGFTDTVGGEQCEKVYAANSGGES